MRFRNTVGPLTLGLLATAWTAAAAAQGPSAAGRSQSGDVPFQFESATLERQELVDAVLSRNRDLAAARWAIEAARARAREVRELGNPTASYGVAPASPFVAETRYGQIAQVSQALPWPGTLARRGEEAAALADATLSDLEALRRELALAASQAFDDYQYVERALAINQEHLALMRAFQEVATSRYAAGLVPQQAPLAAEVEVAQLEHRDIVLTADRRTLLADLNALLHRGPRAPVPPPALEPAPLPDPPDVPLQELIRLALARRPEVAAARARVSARESGVELAHLEGHPSFQAMSTFNSMWGPGAYRWSVTLGVSIPLWRERIRAGVARAQSSLSEQQERLVALEDRIAAGVSAAADRFEESRHALALYETRLVPAARDQTAAARIAFETGQVDFLAVIDAERRLRDVELGLAGGRAEVRRRFATLQRALGALPGDPWPPGSPAIARESDSGTGGSSGSGGSRSRASRAQRAPVPEATARRRTP